MTVHPEASPSVHANAMAELQRLIERGEFLCRKQEEKVARMRRDLAAAEEGLSVIQAAVDAGRADLETLRAAYGGPERMFGRLSDFTQAFGCETEGGAADAGASDVEALPDTGVDASSGPVEVRGKRSIALLRVMEQDRARRWTATDVAERYFTGERPERAVHQVRSGLEFLHQGKRVLDKVVEESGAVTRAYYWICAEWVAVED